MSLGLIFVISIGDFFSKSCPLSGLYVIHISTSFWFVAYGPHEIVAVAVTPKRLTSGNPPKKSSPVVPSPPKYKTASLPLKNDQGGGFNPFEKY